jgi:hypothetical protein
MTFADSNEAEWVFGIKIRDRLGLDELYLFFFFFFLSKRGRKTPVNPLPFTLSHRTRMFTCWQYEPLGLE